MEVSVEEPSRDSGGMATTRKEVVDSQLERENANMNTTSRARSVPDDIVMTTSSIINSLRNLSLKGHVELIEAEIQRLQTIRRVLYTSEHESSDSDKRINFEDNEQWIKQVKCIPKALYVDWFDFKNIYFCDCLGFRKWAQESKFPVQPHALEILATPAKYYWEKQSDTWERRFSPPVAISEPDFLCDNDTHACPREMPDRIRINSKPILAFLQELGTNVEVGSSVVLLRPYKLLIYHRDNIKKHLDGLRRLYPSNANTESHVSEWTPEGDNNQFMSTGDGITDSVSALGDFECLWDFMEKRVLPVEKAYRRDSCRHVRFQDLWHLFKPGDYVVGSVTEEKDIESQQLSEEDSKAEKGSERYPVWRVLCVTGGRPFLSPGDQDDSGRAPLEEKRLSQFRMQVYRIDFSGSQFTIAWATVKWNSFSGERDISTLQLVPLRCHKDQEFIRKDGKETGLHFLAYVTPKYRSYDGPVVQEHHNGSRANTTHSGPSHIIGSVIVDFKEAVQDNRSWLLSNQLPIKLRVNHREVAEDYDVKVWRDKERLTKNCIEDDEIVNDERYDLALTGRFLDTVGFLGAWAENKTNDLDNPNFTDEELMLLPKYVLAFVLQRREFLRLRLDCLKEIQTEKTGWEDLQLRKAHKSLLLAQLESHFQAKSAMTRALRTGIDVTGGKGLGLTFLLHGPPGVGKTSTVECIAAKLQKPLYPITCGDLGTDAMDVSDNLTEIFSKAQKWDCVLLLDEADVFLATRETKDIERNAIVSVFLTALEYYSGVLFLTTNRVGTFDPAFRSRIHFPLYYAPLSHRQTSEIWKVNINRLKSKEAGFVIIEDEDLIDYAQELWDDNHRWNGRQIRNAFQSAVALAQHNSKQGLHSPNSNSERAVSLTREHFIPVVAATEEFESYLAKTHGETESARAKLRQVRNDDFEQASSGNALRHNEGMEPSRESQRWGTPESQSSRQQSHRLLSPDYRQTQRSRPRYDDQWGSQPLLDNLEGGSPSGSRAKYQSRGGDWD
ncbi:hypothetical protein F4781DRAFT_407511 [Annulohypoxylon bovei var. microspora]|nr:hypothetical protein F4781DRAFT_407511 [Annulohypoxylon bovei var. microspora]